MNYSRGVSLCFGQCAQVLQDNRFKMKAAGKTGQQKKKRNTKKTFSTTATKTVTKSKMTHSGEWRLHVLDFIPDEEATHAQHSIESGTKDIRMIFMKKNTFSSFTLCTQP